MDDVEGARTFAVAGATYDAFMGRYSLPLSELFADAAGVTRGTALDVGCGPGALTGVLVSRLGPEAVRGCDPSPSFLEACRARYPGVVLETGRAEALPFPDDVVDATLAQLVLHFVSEPVQAAAEMARVTRPGGTVAACVWDAVDGMEVLRAFWDAASSVAEVPAEAQTHPFGRPGEVVELFAGAGLEEVVESALDVATTYASFEELWNGFLGGVGPAGAYCVSRSEQDRARLREALFARCGSPPGPLRLAARARCVVARVPA
ncbi:MAG: class SAM-dependent methyltransferase [Frankiales bacterium]|nr:class SAM-dependent methyltransferase [Frankiales bacterium]